MKYSRKRLVTITPTLHSRTKTKLDYSVYKKVLLRINDLIAQSVVDVDSGISLPYIGRFIIMKHKPTYFKNIYSQSQPGKKLFNLHSFGYVYKTHWTEKFLLKFPTLYKMRPNRVRIKIPLYNNIMKNEKEYYQLKYK